MAVKFKNELIEFAKDKEGKESLSEWVQVLRTGNFDYWGRTIVLSKEKFQVFIDNFKAEIMGHDLQINFSHKSWENAAAWIKDIEIREDSQLWAKVEWTKSGKEAVLGKDFRYLSAEFGPHYNAETGVTLEDVFQGAALTNIPFLSDMEPITKFHKNMEDNIMNIEELKKKIEGLTTEKTTLSKDNESLKTQVIDFAKVTAKNVELSKENGELKEEIKTLTEDKIESELKVTFDKMLSEGKAVEAQRDSWMKQDIAEFSKLIQEVNKKPKGETNDEEVDLDQKAITLASEKVEKKKITFSQAMSEVLDENEELNAHFNKGGSND